MPTNSSNLKSWLENRCHCHDVRPCRVTIKGETWEACHYYQTLPYGQCDAVSRGLKKATDTYTRQMIYCLGKLPKGYKAQRENKVCYPATSGLDWYIAGYLPLQTTSSLMAQYHPFGINFLLAPWDIPGSKIDEHEAAPYKRLPLAVEFYPVGDSHPKN